MFASILNFITWKVNPVLISLGNIEIRWYGLLLATGFFFSYLTLSKIFKTEGISQQLCDKLSIWAVVWTIVGLRLAHFLFYEPQYFTSLKGIIEIILPIEIGPNGIEFVGYQGLASHGAVIALIIFLTYFARKYKMNPLWLLDRLAICIPIAAGMVRIGNLMNHEIVGSITTVPWAFDFTLGGPGIAGTLRHPAQLYESIVYLLLFVGFVIYYFKFSKGKVPAGRTTGLILFVIFTARFIIEFFKEVQVEREVNMTLDIGQILSIPFIIIGLGLLIYSFIKKDNIPMYKEINWQEKTANKK